MRIAQLSDSHLSRAKPNRTAELEACIRAINELQPAPDLVVHTGDIAHDGEIEDYATAKTCLDHLSRPYFVLAGNRDNRRNLLEVFADGEHLRPDMDFVQYAVEDFDCRLLMIDTVCAESNKGGFCEKRLAHLEQMVLADADRPFVLFLHHPPFQVDVGPEPENFYDWSEAEALMGLVERCDRLLGVFCGHVHRTFETSLGKCPACVVSSVASDVRWDKPHGPNSDRPVFKIRSLASES
jgi:3',5'-cyclic AMP phosphodiesterase CpdA